MTVMVWVADVLFPASSVAVKVRDGVVARSIASGRLVDTSMVTSPQLSDAVASSIGISSEHSTVVSAGTKVNSGAVVS